MQDLWPFIGKNILRTGNKYKKKEERVALPQYKKMIKFTRIHG